jgi:signal transduction histidine kinase
MQSPPPSHAGLWPGGRLTARQADWLITAAAVLVSIALLFVTRHALHPRMLVALAALPLSTVPLLWRRTRPGLALLVLAAGFAVDATIGRAAPGAVGLMFGGYAAALYGRHSVRLVGGAVAGVVLAAAFGTVLATDSTRAVGHLTGIALCYGVCWVLGDRTRARRAHLAALEERAQRLERERDAHARQAAEHERNRIARELHDVVTHNVSVIAVQAGAARATAASHPDRAARVLGLIERTARGTLSELRAQLGVLRRMDDAEPSRRPQPSLAQLDELLAQARDAGLQVESRVDGTPGPCPAMVDMCAYRVVQEALTNTIKHAPGASVHVLVRYADDGLRITVVDNGPGLPADQPSGHGLIGMRERVTLAGGQLRVGRALGGGVRVEARLPLHASVGTAMPV